MPLYTNGRRFEPYAVIPKHHGKRSAAVLIGHHETGGWRCAVAVEELFKENGEAVVLGIVENLTQDFYTWCDKMQAKYLVDSPHRFHLTPHDLLPIEFDVNDDCLEHKLWTDMDALPNDERTEDEYFDLETLESALAQFVGATMVSAPSPVGERTARWNRERKPLKG